MKLIIPALMVLLIFFSGCKKTSKDADYIMLDKSADIVNTGYDSEKECLYGVVTVNRLRFRTSNDMHAKTIRYLDQGVIIDIIAKDESRSFVNELDDYWYKVEFNGTVGWVFGYYIEIYNTYQNAFSASKRISGELNETDLTDSVNTDYIEKYVNNNLMFLSDGKILEITDSAKGSARLIQTEPEVDVVYYVITPDGNTVYYTGSKRNNKQINLYKFSFETFDNKLVSRNTEKVTFSFDRNYAVAVAKQNGEWLLKKVSLDKEDEVVFARIKASKKISDKMNDPLTAVIARERGSELYLEHDSKKNIVTFKPEEEDQAYLVSISDGTFIRIQLIKPDKFRIDANRTFKINNLLEQDGSVLYSIVLKDDITGHDAEVARSPLFPVNFVLSKMNDLVAISMADIRRTDGGLPRSSVYLISISTKKLTPISTDGKSYQPAWRK